MQQEMLITFDYNYKGTIEKAIKSYQYTVLKKLLEHILTEINSVVYNEFIINDLPAIFRCNNIQVNAFMNKTVPE